MDEKNVLNTYESFMQTGKVSDYLRYVQARGEIPPVSGCTTEETVTDAYYNGRNRIT